MSADITFRFLLFPASFLDILLFPCFFPCFLSLEINFKFWNIPNVGLEKKNPCELERLKNNNCGPKLS